MEHEISKEAKVSVELVAGGSVKISAQYAGADASAEVSLTLDSGKLLDALAAKIPGQIDDIAIGLIKSALVAASPAKE